MRNRIRLLLIVCLAEWLSIQPPPVRAAESAAAAVIGRPASPEKIALWKEQAPIGDGKYETANAFVTVHRPAKPNGAAVVICPGGGYGGLVTGAEGSGIARWLNGHGITGVVLEYRLPRGRAFVPLLDAQRAIRTVRAHGKEWGCDPARVGIMGFSAGGHLAATAATHFDDGDPVASDPLDRPGCRPDFAVLVYPVITMGDLGHGGSRRNLLGPEPTPATVTLFSNEKQVTDRTCPTFLAHALDDKVVPAANSRMFYESLRAHQVPARYLELPSGDHGLNGYKGPMWEAWQRESLGWLGSQKIIPEGDARTARVFPSFEKSGGEMQIKGGRSVFGREQETVLAGLDRAGFFSAHQLGEWGYYFHNLSPKESWWRDVYILSELEKSPRRGSRVLMSPRHREALGVEFARIAREGEVVEYVELMESAP